MSTEPARLADILPSVLLELVRSAKRDETIDELEAQQPE